MTTGAPDILDRLRAELDRGTTMPTDAVLADAIAEIERLRAEAVRFGTSDYVEPPTGIRCGHCGGVQRGSATIGEVPVCHTGAPFPDCYRLVTVYGETLGSRNMETQLMAQRGEVERQINDHVQARLAAERERIAQAIERQGEQAVASRAYNREWGGGLRAGMNRAADIVRSGGESR